MIRERPDVAREWARLDASPSPEADWRRFGPYLADRSWGTVREDYSRDGDARAYFPYEHARVRAYRWSEEPVKPPPLIHRIVG